MGARGGGEELREDGRESFRRDVVALAVIDASCSRGGRKSPITSASYGSEGATAFIFGHIGITLIP